MSNRMRQGVQNEVAATKCMSMKLPRFTWSSSQCTNSGNDGNFVLAARAASDGYWIQYNVLDAFDAYT